MSNQRNGQQPSFPLVTHPTNSSLIYPAEGDHMSNFNSTEENYNYQYYQEYKKLYFTAYCLSLQLKKIGKTKDDLCVKLQKIQKKAQEQSREQQKQENPDRKKRIRRTAQQIQRKYYCNEQRCGRNYGSEGSLQQHIKLKHPQLYAKRVEENGYHHCSDEEDSL